MCNACDLAAVHEVVRGEEPDDVPDAFLAAFTMKTDAVQLRIGERAEPGEMEGAEHGEGIEQGVERLLGVAKACGPGVLVVAGNGGSLVGDDQPHPVAVDNLGVHKVRGDVMDGPFTLSLGRRVRGLVQVGDGGTQGFRCLGQDGKRVAVAEKVEERSDVGAGRLGGVARRVGEGGHGGRGCADGDSALR